METFRIAHMLVGVLYGDCLGAPYEGRKGPIADPAVGPSIFGHPAGRGTDDTELTIAAALGILDDGPDMTLSVARRMLTWLHGGPQDVGATTRRGLIEFDHSGNPRTGPDGMFRVANGSLMRSSPFAALDGGPELARDSSKTTHAHPTVLGCVYAYVKMLRSLLNGQPVTVPQIQDWAGRSLHQAVDPTMIPCYGIGHAVYALDLAVWSATVPLEGFEDGIRTIVGLGGDTDTNGAICGAVLAARFGFPSHLLDQLDSDRVDELLELAVPLAVADDHARKPSTRTRQA